MPQRLEPKIQMVRTQGNDDVEQRVVDDVQRAGWHLAGNEINAEGPGFVYSVGLYHTFQQPEIIVFGLDSSVAMIEFIDQVGNEMRGGTSFQDWEESRQFVNGHCCMFRSVERELYAEHLGLAIWFYQGRDFPALQCVWPDTSGNYPWEAAFSAELSGRQPMLTQRIGWPFHEGKNRLVSTTRPVVESRKPVVWVAHDVAGDWQFLCGTTDRTEDGRRVGLETVVESNPSILELADLPVGWQAVREASDRPWQKMRM